MISYDILEWAMAALLALGSSLTALKVFKVAPVWAVVIGMVVFTGLQIPIKTHAVVLEMLRNSN